MVFECCAHMNLGTTHDRSVFRSIFAMVFWDSRSLPQHCLHMITFCLLVLALATDDLQSLDRQLLSPTHFDDRNPYQLHQDHDFTLCAQIGEAQTLLLALSHNNNSNIIQTPKEKIVQDTCNFNKRSSNNMILHLVSGPAVVSVPFHLPALSSKGTF